MINVLYLQFWHINCYLLCKNQQFSLSNVRGFFCKQLYFIIFAEYDAEFFSYFFHDERKKLFRANFVKVFKEFFYNAKGSIVNLSHKSQKVLLNLLYLL